MVRGGGGGEGEGGRASVSEFFYKESKSKKKLWGGGCGSRVDGWTDEQAQTNLSLQLLRSKGHTNALMCKLCP